MLLLFLFHNFSWLWQKYYVPTAADALCFLLCEQTSVSNTITLASWESKNNFRSGLTFILIRNHYNKTMNFEKIPHLSNYKTFTSSYKSYTGTLKQNYAMICIIMLFLYLHIWQLHIWQVLVNWKILIYFDRAEYQQSRDQTI